MTERDALIGFLGSQRRHVLGILDGLSDDDLRKPVLPSGWSCIQLINHLTLDDERFWFEGVVGGDASVITEVENAVADGWHLDPDVPPRTVLAAYEEQIERSDEILRTVNLDASPLWWPSFLGDIGLDDVREVILHVVVETAAHAGHLDVVRELIDGRQWLVLD